MKQMLMKKKRSTVRLLRVNYGIKYQTKTNVTKEKLNEK